MVKPSYTRQQSIHAHPALQGGGSRLLRLDLEITERCNNACQHCYINLPLDDEQAQARELTTAQWQDILRQAADLGVLTVRFTGGEPLVRGDFTELYLSARRLGMKVQIFTNGRLITPGLVDLWKRVPPLAKIEITVYGMRPETYDAAACTPGAWAEFKRGVDLLLENGIPFVVKGSLLPGFKNEMDEFEAWAAQIPWMEGPPAYSMLFDLRARADSPARSRLIQRLRLSPPEVMAVYLRRERQYREATSQFCARLPGPPGRQLFTCGAGLTGSVDAYGFYQPCLLLRDPSLGANLRAVSLKEAFETALPKIRRMEAAGSIYLERCGRCFLRGLCEQCPAKSWMEHGALDRPVDYLCEVAHAQAVTLGLLAEGERAWEVSDWQERLRNLDQNDKEG